VRKYPFDHVDHRVGSIARVRAFYDALMPALGYTKVEAGSRSVEYSCPDEANQFFCIDETADHTPSDTRIAFAAPSRADVDAIGALLGRAGAKKIEGPEDCPTYIQPYYAVFFEDPEGNKLEVCCRR
jgi:catechol 2,3-dioxygenase-like lactoylglutathione lyase family enzyme